MQERFRFRAWDTFRKQYFHDVQFQYDDEVECFGYMLDDTYKERYVVEQCTGLKDKNGNLIWEGDIVEYKIPGIPKIIEVVFWSTAFAHYTKGAQLLSTYQKTTVIIGNIHENPELVPRHYHEHLE